MPFFETTNDTARPTISKLMAHPMPLPEETSNTARPTKRKLIGAHEAALRDNKGVTKRTPQGWR
jgi:hypothetical protein